MYGNDFVFCTFFLQLFSVLRTIVGLVWLGAYFLCAIGLNDLKVLHVCLRVVMSRHGPSRVGVVGCVGGGGGRGSLADAQRPHIQQAPFLNMC